MYRMLVTKMLATNLNLSIHIKHSDNCMFIKFYAYNTNCFAREIKSKLSSLTIPLNHSLTIINCMLQMIISWNTTILITHSKYIAHLAKILCRSLNSLTFKLTLLLQ